MAEQRAVFLTDFQLKATEAACERELASVGDETSEEARAWVGVLDEVKVALGKNSGKVEERVEYRVVGERRGEQWQGRTYPELAAVERNAERLRKPGPYPNSNLRIQKRTVTESPWVDVEEGSGG